MKFFWKVFVVTSVVGSVVIYVAAPLVGPRLMVYFRGAESPVAKETVTAQDVNEQTVAPIQPAPVTPPKAHQDEGDVSPALEGVYPAKSNEPPGWGVTSHKVSYYKADGSYAGTVEGGVLFDCIKTVTSSKGAMVACRFLQEGMPDELFLIGRKDAQFFTATHQKLSKSRIQALKDYYALNGKIEARRAEILERGAQRNPYFADARATHEAFQKHIQEAKRLEQMRDKLTDTKRMELEDQLREMKLKEVTLKKTFEETQEKYVSWKKAHAADLPDPENDADIKKWKQEKKRLADALPGLAY